MNQRFTVTASIVLAMLIASMDTTILHTTMPVIAAEFDQFRFYAWTFTAYVLASTSLMPIAGRLADLFGRKRLFAGGIVLFMVGSLLCGTSASMLQLVLFRVLQGMGAGIMMPLVQIIAGDLFSVEKRGKIQALFTSMWLLSALLAPVLGAFFVEVANWRWIFYINIPIGLLALGMLLPYKDVYAAKRTQIDWLGAILFASGTASLLLVTVIVENRTLFVMAGLLLITLFIVHERRHPSPMISARLFQKGPLIWILVNNFVVCLALFGLPNYIPLFLQDQGHTVLFSGIALIAMSLGWMAFSVNSGKWIIRFGYRPLLIVGNSMFLAAASLFFLVQWIPYFIFFFFALILLGAAFGLIFTVSIIGAQQLVDPQDKGMSTSLQMFVRNTGLAAGVSIMGLIMNESASIPAGMHHLFTYGFVGSILAFGTAWFIREQQGTARGI